MKKVLKDIDALLVTNPTNIRYLTGFVGVDERDAYVLLTPDILYFFTNSLYIESVKNIQSPILNTQIKIIDDVRDHVFFNAKEVAEDSEFAKGVVNFLDLFRGGENVRYQITTKSNIPLAAGVLAFKGIFLEPALAALFMSLSTVIVAVNAMMLRNKSL